VLYSVVFVWITRSWQSGESSAQVACERFQYIQSARWAELSTTFSTARTGNIPVPLHMCVLSFCDRFTLQKIFLKLVVVDTCSLKCFDTDGWGRKEIPFQNRWRKDLSEDGLTPVHVVKWPLSGSSSRSSSSSNCCCYSEFLHRVGVKKEGHWCCCLCAGWSLLTVGSCHKLC